MFTRNCLIAVMLSAWLWAGDSRAAKSAHGPLATLVILSTAFSQGQMIPKKYTCSGSDVSPPLTWGLPPDGTKSMAVIVDDTDAPGGTFTHWVLFNLSPDAVTLKENVLQTKTLPAGAKQGVNDFGKVGYGGPCPPPGKPHHYHFKVYALDERLNLSSDAKGKDLTAALKNHVIAEGELMGIEGH